VVVDWRGGAGGGVQVFRTEAASLNGQSLIRARSWKPATHQSLVESRGILQKKCAAGGIQEGEVESGKWKVESGKWKVKVGKWKVEVESGSGKWEWKVESGSGKWKMKVGSESGKWKVESGK